jgi:hypothetical protein
MLCFALLAFGSRSTGNQRLSCIVKLLLHRNAQAKLQKGGWREWDYKLPESVLLIRSAAEVLRKCC